MALRRHAEIHHEYSMIADTLEAIESGSEIAKQLNSQLDHEKLVLGQKKQVTLPFRINSNYHVLTRLTFLHAKQEFLEVFSLYGYVCICSSPCLLPCLDRTTCVGRS